MRISGIKSNSLFFGGTPVNQIKKIKVLGAADTDIKENSDGSFIVDDITGTKIYYGQAAKHYLENTSKFEENTEIISQSMTKIKVVCDEGEYTLDEPGAILINKGKEANIKVLEGSPLVVEYKRKPLWYNELKPDNKHWDYFAYLARRNHEIYFCDKQGKISPYQNPGEITEEDFKDCPPWVFSKLYNRHLIVDNENHTTNWGGFWDNNNFRRDLYEQAGIYGDVKRSILDVWHKTTKSGYDLSGLVKTFDGISIYNHKDKFNQHNNRPTEWITNSTAWAGGTPFIIGVSHVLNSDSDAPRDFNSIRKTEQIHVHQEVNNPKHNLKEIYIPTQGSAVLLTLQDGKPVYHELQKGEVTIVPPGMEHGIVAINGEYEHLCTQTPCAFQYGIDFKNISRAFDDTEKDKALLILQKKGESPVLIERNIKNPSLFDKTSEEQK